MKGCFPLTYSPTIVAVFAMLVCASGCVKVPSPSDRVVICASCIPSGCRAVVTPDGKVTYEREMVK